MEEGVLIAQKSSRMAPQVKPPPTPSSITVSPRLTRPLFTATSSASGTDAAECHHGLSCADISLEESCHSVRVFHIFKNLEEDDFLFIREREGDRRYDLFYKFCIKGDLWGESFTCISRCIFLLDSYELESEELAISEFSFCSLK